MGKSSIKNWHNRLNALNFVTGPFIPGVEKSLEIIYSNRLIWQTKIIRQNRDKSFSL